MRIPIEGWAGTSFSLNVRPRRSHHLFASIHARDRHVLAGGIQAGGP